MTTRGSGKFQLGNWLLYSAYNRLQRLKLLPGLQMYVLESGEGLSHVGGKDVESGVKCPPKRRIFPPVYRL